MIWANRFMIKLFQVTKSMLTFNRGIWPHVSVEFYDLVFDNIIKIYVNVGTALLYRSRFLFICVRKCSSKCVDHKSKIFLCCISQVLNWTPKHPNIFQKRIYLLNALIWTLSDINEQKTGPRKSCRTFKLKLHLLNHWMYLLNYRIGKSLNNRKTYYIYIYNVECSTGRDFPRQSRVFLFFAISRSRDLKFMLLTRSWIPENHEIFHEIVKFHDFQDFC